MLHNCKSKIFLFVDWIRKLGDRACFTLVASTQQNHSFIITTSYPPYLVRIYTSRIGGGAQNGEPQIGGSNTNLNYISNLNL